MVYLWKSPCFWWKGSMFWCCCSYLPQGQEKMKVPVYPFMWNAHILLRRLPQRPGFGSLCCWLPQGDQTVPDLVELVWVKSLPPLIRSWKAAGFPRAVTDWALLSSPLEVRKGKDSFLNVQRFSFLFVDRIQPSQDPLTYQSLSRSIKMFNLHSNHSSVPPPHVS